MEEIIPIGKNMNWISARDAVKERGGLPSNVLHDEYLVMSEMWKKLDSSYYAAWCREVLTYPKADGVFKTGEDVTDAYTDDEGRSWIFLSKDIPKSALNKKNLALFVDPKEVEVTKERVIIHPKSVTIVNDFPQSNQWGKSDETTRVTITTTEKNLEWNQKRYLYRISGAGVRPLARYYGFYGYGRRVVLAGWWQDFRLGVAYVKPSGKEAKSDRQCMKQKK